MQRHICRIVLQIVAVAAVAAVLATSTAATTRDEILAAVRSGDTASALERLTELEAGDPERFRANNYDYLLGRVLEVRGDFAGAAARYTGVLDRGSNLAEYALWRLAGLARLEGNFSLERQYLERIIGRYPGSVLTVRAIERAARSAYDAGDFKLALARLLPLAGTSGAGSRDALDRVATCRMQLGDAAGARRDFQRLLDGPPDDAAVVAARGLDELDAAEGVVLTEFDHVRRGRVYLNNRDWLGARRHFLEVTKMPAALNRVEALYTVGLTYYRTEEHDAAVQFWDTTAAEFPDHPSGIRAALWAGHSLQRAGRFSEAVARYDAFIVRYPRDDQVESAYRNAIDSWRSAGDAARALQWCQRAESAQPARPLATFAAFNRAKIRLASGDTAGALADFTRLKQGYPMREQGPGQPAPGEADLLRAVCLERLGRVPEAVAAYLAIRAGRDAYFGNRASERLIALGKSPKGRNEVGKLLEASVSLANGARSSGNAAAAKDSASRALRLTDDAATRRAMLDVLQWAYGKLPAYSRVVAPTLEQVGRTELAGNRPVSDRSHGTLASELAFLGLWDEAAPELASSGFGSRSPFSMAVYNARGARADDAMQLGESIVAKLPDDFRVELLPRAVAELVYPAPYADALRSFALPLDVDPRFELSIARQESRFQPWVKSAAAARGLMQFIPETASKIAKSLKIEPFDQDDLYDPRIAIRIGARYLADLYALFPGNHAAVAASYNGGEDNVARWMKRSADPADIDLVVAEISFKESKGYVFKVMNNFWAYQALYSRDLGPR